MNIRDSLLVVSLSVTAAGLHAEGETPVPVIDPHAPISAWAVCPPPPARDYDLHFAGDPGQAPTYLVGDLAERNTDGTITLFGDAQAQRGSQQVQAERIIYNEINRTVEAEGGFRLDDSNMSLSGSHGTLWLDEDRGEFFQTRFWVYDRHARGKAKKTFLLEPGVTKYKRATYTTCAEGVNNWRLSANTVTLDQNTGKGVARNAQFRIKGVPILYTPYVSFPIDDRRKTGFLIPSFGTSDNSGFELRTPFYINLAPNYDATITPRYLEDRGTQFITEFRYLSPQQEGNIGIEYLHKDDITRDNRNRITIRDEGRFGRHLTTNIDYDRVSDKDYLTDLGDSLSLASITHLQRSAQAQYTTSWWQLGVQVDDYQTVDKNIAQSDRPYQRLPRTTFGVASPLRPLGIETQLYSEFVRFDADEQVTADRVDLWPDISLPIRRSAFESIPRLGLRYTAYKLDNQAPGTPENPTRTTPFFSMDNILYFERDLAIGSAKYTQTLEPRLFYLWVKGQNQDDIPLFDSSEPAFSYRELFEVNRFNGADRMGDANQAALAVSSRFIDPNTGAEKFRASIGQLFYFENRNVTLEDSEPQDDNESDVVGEMELALSRSWNGKADMIWNTRDNVTDRANARIQYTPGFRKIANLSYRYIKGEQNQIDASVLWPLTPSWHVLGRFYYDLKDSQKLETLAGFEYDSCCWGVRFVTRDYIDDSSQENRIFLAQIVLKGLGSFGSNIESLLQDGILGWSERPID
ncbi:MAG: LPS assembly protein LptD [Thiogranum sp.]